MPDTTLSTLDQIRIKVRRLSRSPSVNQISDADIDTYVNNFVLYDFPQSVRLFDLRKTFTFYTVPNVDTYSTNYTQATQPLFNYKNLIVSIHDPVYVAGYKMYFTQGRSEFFGMWPKISTRIQIGTGDGITTLFAGVLSNIPILPRNVTISSLNTGNNPLILKDVPLISPTTGIQIANEGNLYVPDTEPATPPIVLDPFNNIDYVTGSYTITFASAPGAGQAIWMQTVPYVAARPSTVLYFDDTFTIRPVPDITYPVTFEAYVRPLELLSGSQVPEISQWWQYIAYGASIKLLQDRNDLDTVQLLMPEFNKQERLVLRKTLVQEANDRVATIYAQQASLSAGPWGWGWGYNNF